VAARAAKAACGGVVAGGLVATGEAVAAVRRRLSLVAVGAAGGGGRTGVGDGDGRRVAAGAAARAQAHDIGGGRATLATLRGVVVGRGVRRREGRIEGVGRRVGVGAGHVAV